MWTEPHQIWWVATYVPSVTYANDGLSQALKAVAGGMRITSGTATVGEVQAMIQYTRNFAQPLTMP